MRRFVAFLILFIALCIAVSPACAQRGNRPLVNNITIDGVIDPAVALYVQRSIKAAEENGAQALIISIDTPGGLLDSTRSIFQSFYGSRVPIVVYVSPQGARAASAGAIIAMAANIAAMSPGTNLGAAHPVGGNGQALDPVMSKKAENDTAAYVRTIARRRGRNVLIAEQIVRQSVSFTETEAKDKRIIDIIARDRADLLRQINGRTVKVGNRDVVIRSANSRTEPIETSLRERFLHIVANPNIAYILMLIAVYGIIFELNNPGAILPGVVGGLALIMALFSFAVLPINLAGILLILFAIALFIIDLFTPSHGILTAGGIISFAIGSLILFETHSSVFRLSLTLVIVMTLLTGAFFLFLVGAGIRAQTCKIVTGSEGMIGKEGVARTDINPEGKVFADGTLWNAVAEDGFIKKGDRVRVVAMSGLELTVIREELILPDGCGD